MNLEGLTEGSRPRCQRSRDEVAGDAVPWSFVNSRTTKPAAWSSLRRQASFARSGPSVASPTGHSSTGCGPKPKSTRAIVAPFIRKICWQWGAQSCSAHEAGSAFEVAVAAGVRHQLVEQSDAGPPGDLGTTQALLRKVATSGHPAPRCRSLGSALFVDDAARSTIRSGSRGAGESAPRLGRSMASMVVVRDGTTTLAPPDDQGLWRADRHGSRAKPSKPCSAAAARWETSGVLNPGRARPRSAAAPRRCRPGDPAPAERAARRPGTRCDGQPGLPPAGEGLRDGGTTMLAGGYGEELSTGSHRARYLSVVNPEIHAGTGIRAWSRSAQMSAHL